MKNEITGTRHFIQATQGRIYGSGRTPPPSGIRIPADPKQGDHFFERKIVTMTIFEIFVDPFF